MNIKTITKTLGRYYGIARYPIYDVEESAGNRELKNFAMPLLVFCDGQVYDVTDNPEIYFKAKEKEAGKEGEL